MSDFANYLNKTTTVKNTAVVYDLKHLGVLEVHGKDAIPFLQRMTTNNVAAMGQSIATIFANDKGRIIDSVYVVKFNDKLLLICHNVHRDPLASWIEKYTILDDVAIHKSSDYFLWQLWHYKLENPKEVLSFWMNEESVQIIGTREQQQQLLENLRTDGVQYCEENIYEHNRIEKAIPIAPNEINDTVNPHEVTLIDYVDFDKGCYVGQEVIARLDTYDKVQKYLRRFSCESKKVTCGSEIYTTEGKKAGSVTSISHLHDTSIGLALIHKKFLAEKNFVIDNGAEKETISLLEHASN